MRGIATFVKLPVADKLAVAKAAFLLLLTRGALAILPLRYVDRTLQGVARLRSKRGPCSPEQRQRVVRATRAAARRFASQRPCLPRALVARCLLQWSGCETTLHIGVAKGPAGDLLAHAWVVCEGEVLVGGCRSPEQYVTIRVWAKA